MKRCVTKIIVGALLIMIAGCSHLEGYLDIVKEKGMTGEYQAVLKKWTRSQIIYSQFETQVHISATYQSPEFKRAYLNEYSRIYHLREEDRKAQEDLQKGLISDFTEFIFYAYLPEKTSNDFDRRTSIWTVFLVDPKGDRVNPVELRKIDPVTPIVTEFFPYVNPHYGISYRLRFPPLNTSTGDDKTLKLVFTGVIGTVELKFEGQ